MDGLWVLLLAAFGIASAVMKRMEKPTTSGERPQSGELKKYMDTVGKVLKEVEQTFDDRQTNAPAPQKVRRRVAQDEAVETARPERQRTLPNVSAQFEQTVKIPPITEQRKAEKKPRISQKQLREAMIWSEILQPPVSKRKK